MPSLPTALKTLIGRRSRPGAKYPDGSWFWPVLEEYRDSEGRTIEEVEFANAAAFFESEAEREEAVATRRWLWSPKSQKGVDQLIVLLEAFFADDEEFTYLEFGTCFGTTLARVLSHFRNAHAIGLEVNLPRFHVTRWLINRMDPVWNLSRRVDLHCASLFDAPLAPDSIDAVFMDTSHIYPDDFDYIMCLLRNAVLRKGFIFVGDDPTHTGTDMTRRRFITEHGAKYKVLTRADKNLWWFFGRARGARFRPHSTTPTTSTRAADASP